MDKATWFSVAMIVAVGAMVVALIVINRPRSVSRPSGRPTIRPSSVPSPAFTNSPSKAPSRQIAERFSASSPIDSFVSSAAPLAPLAPPAAVKSYPSVKPSEPLSNEKNRAFDFSNHNTVPTDPSPGTRLTAEDLLPRDAADTKWAQVTPCGQGDVGGINFVNAGWSIGINTQGSSLGKNANLQLRSDPINPSYKVSPWNQSTVEPDVSRRPFEIGGDDEP